MRPPAFRFYVDNFVEGTVSMTDSEAGLYIRLLCAQWSNGGLPNDDAELARFSRGSTTVQPDLNRVRQKFKLCPDGLLRNERLETERAKQMSYSETQSAKGKASAQARINRGSTGVQPALAPKPNLPFPLPLPSPIALDTPVEFPAGFPTTEAEAECAAAVVGCGAEFAAQAWNKAAGRGGRDAKGNPITRWANQLAFEWSCERAKRYEQKQQPQGTRGRGPSVFEMTKALEIIQEKIDRLKMRGHEDAHGLVLPEADRPEYKRLCGEKKRLKNEIEKQGSRTNP